MAIPTLVCCVSSITKKLGSNTFKYNKLIFRENSHPSGFPSFLSLYFLPHMAKVRATAPITLLDLIVGPPNPTSVASSPLL